MATEVEYQRQVTRLALDALAGGGFALAGSGAIREHGITDRPTQDIDLFTAEISTDSFASSVSRLSRGMQEQGYQVTIERSAPQYARLSVGTMDGYMVDVDLAVDWRAAEPVTLWVGPVLSLNDAVASKVSDQSGQAPARSLEREKDQGLSR